MRPGIRTTPMLAAFIALTAATLSAQDPRATILVQRGGQDTTRMPRWDKRADTGDNVLEQRLFPPDLVLQCRERIGLKPDQRDAVRSAVREMQSKTLDLQWKLQDESEKLTDALKRPTVNEAETLAQVDRVLSAEREVKRAQMGMLIRVKNTLTAEQQESLRSLRQQQYWATGGIRGCDSGGE
jgi:hypothetical protein